MLIESEGFLLPCPAPSGNLGISKGGGGQVVCIDQQRCSILCNFIVGSETVVAEEGGRIPSSKVAIGHIG